MSERETLSSVRNAARLLKQFTAREREYGVSELARRLELSKSTVHRLLTTLAVESLVEQDPVSGKYRLGLAVYDLGASVTRHLDLHEAVATPMERLRNAVGETVQVAVLDGREVVYVERLDSPNTLRLFLEIGRRNWAHTTATGKVLLAFQREEALNRIMEGWRLAQSTEYTVTDPALLRKQLHEIRLQGFAHNIHESEVGVFSVAAPIRDISGRVVAAMSVAGPADRMDPILDKVTMGVIEAAAMASRKLGHHARR